MFFIELIFITKYPEVWFFKLDSCAMPLAQILIYLTLAQRKHVLAETDLWGHPRQNVSKY